MRFYLTKEELLKKQIRKSYPECEKCPFWEKRKTSNEVYCFYRYKDRCVLKER